MQQLLCPHSWPHSSLEPYLGWYSWTTCSAPSTFAITRIGLRGTCCVGMAAAYWAHDGDARFDPALFLEETFACVEEWTGFKYWLCSRLQMQTLILQDFHHTCLKIRSVGTDKQHLPWHLSGHDTLAVLAWQRDYWASDRGILVVLSVQMQTLILQYFYTCVKACSSLVERANGG